MEYRRRYPYVYGAYPALIPFGYGLPVGYVGLPFGNDEGGDGGQQQADDRQPDGPEDPMPLAPGPELNANAAPIFRPAYQGQAEEAPVKLQPATTLIFNDGRPPAQVHNYAITGSTLYALDDESRQEIPLSLINVPKTVEANHAAGVDFALPVSH